MKTCSHLFAVMLVLVCAATVLSQTDSLKCDVPYVGRIASIGETDFVSFSVAANQIISIIIVPSVPAGTNFQPYWRLLDRFGNSASSCGASTISSQADCGPLPVSGNPYRIEITDFLMMISAITASIFNA